MNKLLGSIILSALIISCGSNPTTNDLAVNTPIVASLDLVDLSEDQIKVEINPGRFQTDTVTYYLPRVVQGTYSVSDFGKYIRNFTAFNYDGALVDVTKLDTNSWQITNASQVDKIIYSVEDTFDQEAGGAAPFSPSGTNIEQDIVVLNLHGFVGYFDQLKQNQYEINITSPAAFSKTAALPLSKTTPTEDSATVTDTYLAARYFDVTDNPMMYGDLDVERFQVGDIEIVLSVYSPNNVHTAASIKENVFTMMQAQKAYMGDINSTPRYDIYLYLAEAGENAPRGFGALEHHTSTVVVLPEQMPKEQLDASMTDVVSHEFFHIVTPLSVHSEDVHYFDYNDPTFSKHLWMYEGVTEYFATLFQIDQDLVDQEAFYAKIMGKIKASMSYDDSMSFTTMSENILEAPYDQNYVNVYSKGALIGMCIDILMREESEGQRGILSLMKELSTKYGVNKPFEDDALIAEITAMTYPSVGEFLRTHVEGTTPIDYNRFFEKVGLTIKTARVETNYIQNDGALIVGANREEGTLYFNDLVAENSFWNDAGVKSGDVIKSLNESEVTLANANMVISQTFSWQEGDEVTLKVMRDGEEVVLTTNVAKSYTQGKTLTEVENPTQAQKELRKAWLKG